MSMSTLRRMTMTLVAMMVPWSLVFAQSVAKVTSIEGKAQILRVGAKEWVDLRPNLALKVGDQLFTQGESFVEIRYTMGAVLRLDEGTKITIESSSDKTTQTRNSIGQVWVNMKKMVSSGKEFEVSSPTATAAIRGTVFQMSTAKDSTSDVSVYDGKVAVGPSNGAVAPTTIEPPKSQAPSEVGGPEEVPGPYEVPLDNWLTIVAGQKISVRKDGKFAQKKFDMKAAEGDEFVKKCRELDKKLMQE